MARVSTVTVSVRDGAIHCRGCEARIEAALKQVPGVLRVKADHQAQTVSVTLDLARLPVETVCRRLAEMGYPTGEGDPK